MTAINKITRTVLFIGLPFEVKNESAQSSQMHETCAETLHSRINDPTTAISKSEELYYALGLLMEEKSKIMQDGYIFKTCTETMYSRIRFLKLYKSIKQAKSIINN